MSGPSSKGYLRQAGSLRYHLARIPEGSIYPCSVEECFSSSSCTSFCTEIPFVSTDATLLSHFSAQPRTNSSSKAVCYTKLTIFPLHDFDKGQWTWLTSKWDHIGTNQCRIGVNVNKEPKIKAVTWQAGLLCVLSLKFLNSHVLFSACKNKIKPLKIFILSIRERTMPWDNQCTDCAMGQGLPPLEEKTPYFPPLPAHVPTESLSACRVSTMGTEYRTLYHITKIFWSSS
jgi:hypothetical protein